MRINTTAATLVIACAAPFAEAAPGDPYHKAEWCHTSGESGVHWGTGDCESATATIESFPGYSVKGCTDLTEGGVAPNGGNFADILLDPQVINSGPLINLGQLPQGISVVLYPGGSRNGKLGKLSAARFVQNRLEIAPFSLAEVLVAAGLAGVQMYQPGQPGVIFPYRGDQPVITDIQGDFELFLHVPDANDPTLPPVLIRQPINISELNFAPSTLPCSPADVDGNQSIDVFDLILFLQNFDPNANCPGGTPCQIADIDGNGAIDVFDLIAFLQAFDPRDPNCQGDATPA